MKELEFIDIIKKTLDNDTLIGDDCAYLKDLDIFVTHDTLVEDVHFSMNTTSPYLLGRKSVSVNISDLCAALAIPKYITVSLSLPRYIPNSFVKELYRGINDICKEADIKTAGGDITSSSKIVISICAIGKKTSEFITSRKFARINDLIVVTGEFGSSGAGLYGLMNFLYTPESLKNIHLNPKLRIKEAAELRNNMTNNIALMDTSDGLIDALYKISRASGHNLKIDINSVPFNTDLIEFCTHNNLNYKDFIKWGAEDYELLACIPESMYKNLDKSKFKCIGSVQNKDTNSCVFIEDNGKIQKITKDIFEQKSYNHFKEGK
ncbi:MAG: thiamine-phosphate kinase [Candidatus Gastranaerophilales bacterium]|nr:thiamine-phosphate kinase [Candidatus Gastranaerophilales bacterium]